MGNKVLEAIWVSYLRLLGAGYENDIVFKFQKGRNELLFK